MKPAHDAHLIFNSQHQSVIEAIDLGLRRRGILPWLWNRDVPEAEDYDQAEIASIRSTPVSVIFLGAAGWGPHHRKYAEFAYSAGRPIIPVVLPDWRESDLTPPLEDPFRRLRRIQFKTHDDSVALDALARRIVEMPYHRASGGNTRATAASRDGRRMIVYVPARSQTIRDWESLRAKLEQEPALRDCLWYGHNYRGDPFSREKMEDLAVDLDARIRGEILAAERTAPVTAITLMGHSFGGVLVRMAYLMSAGQYAGINRCGFTWWERVDRIVLFAAPNRGIRMRRLPWRARVAAYWPFGRAGQLTRDQLLGSEAITNLRILWIRFFAELDGSSKPAVVQFLGRGDRYVDRDDSLDIEQFGDACQYDVPGATHDDVHKVPDSDAARYEVLRYGILEPVPGGSPAVAREDHRNPVVLILHGIRAGNEAWVEEVRRMVERRAGNALAIGPTYQYFSLLDFAIPWIREKKLRFFHDQYSEQLARHPLSRFCFIGHSNGTYLLGHALKRIPGMAFDRVALVGSVLPREYEWRERFQRSQVRDVVNLRAAGDVPVSIACNLLRSLRMKDVGTAGVFGFDETRESIREIYYYKGGHSAALTADNLVKVVDYVFSGDVDFPLSQQDVTPYALLSRLSGSTLVAIAVAALLLALLGGCAWAVFLLLGGTIPWVSGRIAVACLLVLITFYLFSRYY